MRIAILILGAIILGGCTRTIITSTSPDGSAAVQVTKMCTNDCHVWVDLNSAVSSKRIIERNGCDPGFAHVWWSAHSRKAVIYVDNGYQNIQEAWDVRTTSPVPFEPLANQFRASITRQYGLHPVDLAAYGGDPLEWGRIVGRKHFR